MRKNITFQRLWILKTSDWFENTWWAIRNWFSPRQKWLTKKIPNRWTDKDVLWEICILEGIKHYVEDEDALKDFEISQKDPEYPDHQKKFDREVQWAYDETTIRLPFLEKKLEWAWKKVPHWNLEDINTRKIDYDATYGETDRLEKEIADLKTKVMIWAVKNRGSIWT